MRTASRKDGFLRPFSHADDDGLPLLRALPGQFPKNSLPIPRYNREIRRRQVRSRLPAQPNFYFNVSALGKRVARIANRLPLNQMLSARRSAVSFRAAAIRATYSSGNRRDRQASVMPSSDEYGRQRGAPSDQPLAKQSGQYLAPANPVTGASDGEIQER